MPSMNTSAGEKMDIEEPETEEERAHRVVQTQIDDAVNEVCRSKETRSCGVYWV